MQHVHLKRLQNERNGSILRGKSIQKATRDHLMLRDTNKFQEALQSSRNCNRITIQIQTSRVHRRVCKVRLSATVCHASNNKRLTTTSKSHQDLYILINSGVEMVNVRAKEIKYLFLSEKDINSTLSTAVNALSVRIIYFSF